MNRPKDAKVSKRIWDGMWPEKLFNRKVVAVGWQYCKRQKKFFDLFEDSLSAFVASLGWRFNQDGDLVRRSSGELIPPEWVTLLFRVSTANIWGLPLMKWDSKAGGFKKVVLPFNKREARRFQQFLEIDDQVIKNVKKGQKVHWLFKCTEEVWGLWLADMKALKQSQKHKMN